MNTKRKVAVIGCGSISKTHIAAIRSLGNTEIAALCDIREDRLSEDALLCPEASLYTDYKTMLDEISVDAVHICTPHYLHAEMAIAAMEHGFSVYLEKPCAMNRPEAEEIVRVSEKTGKTVCVSFQNRLNDTTVKAKEIIENGSLGALRGGKGIVAWHREGAYYSESGWRGKFATEGGGVLMNQSIHTLDLLYHFLGKAKLVKGHAALFKNTDTCDVEDMAEAYIVFQSGATGVFFATTCNATDSSVEIELYFEKGTLRINHEALYLYRDGTVTTLCTNDMRITGKACWGSGHVRMIGAFYDALDGKESDYCDLRDAIPVLDIIAGIYRDSAVRPKIL